ncbi:maternal effect embryo arrest 9 [Hibiscus trionum]|uniref:Maternal effect embryo arrest 9 n=1 Tax=Hibiscus trionum TaxID=183268 RepID=A0A9W7MM52_HIBTR|nr:maternal effect embryo arrest 9 [Hibiscus trionum]
MEALLTEFSFLSDQALEDKKFDPSTIVDLMKLFEIESYKAWAAMELEQEKQVKEIETSMQQAEDYLDSVMEEAMDEFRRFEEEMEDMCKAELKGLKDTAVKARKMGNLMEKAATVASKKYMQAALNSASATAKSAWKGLSSKKVHPS